MNIKEKLIVALDVDNIEKAKDLVEKIGDDAVFYKIGLELMMSGEYFDLIKFLKNKNKKVFADLKLYDISNTVAKTIKNLNQYEIDLLTIHTASFDIMKKASENKGNTKIIAVTVLTNIDEADLKQMGFDSTLSLDELVLKKTKMALDCKIDGVVSSALRADNLRYNLGNDFLIVSPGIRLENIKNDDQKQVADVETAIKNKVSHLVVGRPITQSLNPKLMANLFIKKIEEAQKKCA